MRNHSLARVSHLLGHSARRKTANEITAEIRQEKIRSFDDSNTEQYSSGLENVKAVRTCSGKNDKISRFGNLWKKGRTLKYRHSGSAHRFDTHETNNNRTHSGGHMSPIQNKCNGHTSNVNNDDFRFSTIDTDSIGLNTGLFEAPETEKSRENIGDIVLHLTEELQTVSKNTSALLNGFHVSEKTEMTHI